MPRPDHRRKHRRRSWNPTGRLLGAGPMASVRVVTPRGVGGDGHGEIDPMVLSVPGESGNPH